ncbi:MAG TPA: flavodoxin-dependent (E)-4-hydroxy-3-methylbut-2-enyl-diphosphate synthase, partial [Tepidisphaeraceae bacterium]|nr:flavodoxin-dependent (E)-4-hydroxy-3-methylbut-2-enyl-diphosphate synthase [Tepidisphaeraceae bacterium]
MADRRKTRQLVLGDEAHGFVRIGGDAPVSVQSMTSTYTHDVATCVREIQKLAAAGADIVRVAVPERKDTEALKEILPQVTVPIVADVHFHFQRALEAIDAGVHKIRLNPGNIQDRAQVKDVIQA